MFDAQCDFAAVVYGVRDNPDRLLLDFTEDLRRSGVCTAGLVQLNSWMGQSDDHDVRTVVLSPGPCKSGRLTNDGPAFVRWQDDAQAPTSWSLRSLHPQHHGSFTRT